ncbi:MAG: hypothetical protein WD989_00625 [Candidatus Paceibacterota bacterium]
MSSNTEFAIAEVMPGKLNAMVKNIMSQVGVTDPNEAVRLINSGERVVVEPSALNKCWMRAGNLLIVNLPAAPSLPFKGATVEQHIGDGVAFIEPRPDGLWMSIGGTMSFRKIVLHLSERQMNGKYLKGYKLREELSGKPVLNANVLDALAENIDLIPEDWKRDEKGNIRFIFFWGTIYRNPDTDYLYVRYLYFNDGTWLRDYGWLDLDWLALDPAALLASN